MAMRWAGACLALLVCFLACGVHAAPVQSAPSPLDKQVNLITTNQGFMEASIMENGHVRTTSPGDAVATVVPEKQHRPEAAEVVAHPEGPVTDAAVDEHAQKVQKVEKEDAHVQLPEAPATDAVFDEHAHKVEKKVEDAPEVEEPKKMEEATPAVPQADTHSEQVSTPAAADSSAHKGVQAADVAETTTYPSEPHHAYPEEVVQVPQPHGSVDTEHILTMTEGDHKVASVPAEVVVARKPPKTTTPSITFAIPTMRRRAKDGSPAPVKYLTPLVEGIISDLNEEQRRQVKVFLYNVDRQPEEHAEVHDLVKRYPELVMSANKPKRDHAEVFNDDDIVQLEKSDGHVHEMSLGFFNWISGETNDAANLLFEARKLSPYVVFLEDDVKPTSSVVSKLSDYLYEMDARSIDSWFMIDLYTPKIDWGRNPLYVHNFEPYDYECCTQAMLFRSDKLLDLLLYETSHPNMPIDDNIRDYSREAPESRQIFAIVPNLFEHVGIYSSNPEKTRDVIEHESINFVP